MTPPGEPPAAVRVLVCDDHRVLAEGLVALLNAAGDLDVVGVASSVAELVETAMHTKPDVVVLDFDLPDGTGIDALHVLREVVPETRVIMLTAFADDPVLVRAIEAGCAGFLTKRKAAADVVEAVRMVGAGEAVLAPDLLARLLPRFSRGAAKHPASLTQREEEVLDLLVEGESNSNIARKLGVSPNTVRNHVQGVLTKLGAHSRLEAVAIAVREGLVHRNRT